MEENEKFTRCYRGLEQVEENGKPFDSNEIQEMIQQEKIHKEISKTINKFKKENPGITKKELAKKLREDALKKFLQNTPLEKEQKNQSTAKNTVQKQQMYKRRQYNDNYIQNKSKAKSATQDNTPQRSPTIKDYYKQDKTKNPSYVQLTNTISRNINALNKIEMPTNLSDTIVFNPQRSHTKQEKDRKQNNTKSNQVGIK